MTRGRRASYFSTRRITAMVLRYFYLLRGSIPRIIELAYWPTMQMLIWGFMSQFLYGHSEWFVRAGGILIALAASTREELNSTLSLIAAVAATVVFVTAFIIPFAPDQANTINIATGLCFIIYTIWLLYQASRYHHRTVIILFLFYSSSSCVASCSFYILRNQ